MYRARNYTHDHIEPGYYLPCCCESCMEEEEKAELKARRITQEQLYAEHAQRRAQQERYAQQERRQAMEPNAVQKTVGKTMNIMIGVVSVAIFSVVAAVITHQAMPAVSGVLAAIGISLAVATIVVAIYRAKTGAAL